MGIIMHITTNNFDSGFKSSDQQTTDSKSPTLRGRDVDVISDDGRISSMVRVESRRPEDEEPEASIFAGYSSSQQEYTVSDGQQVSSSSLEMGTKMSVDQFLKEQLVSLVLNCPTQVSNQFLEDFAHRVFWEGDKLRQLSSEQFAMARQIMRAFGLEDALRMQLQREISMLLKQHTSPMQTVDLVLSIGEALSWLHYTCYDLSLAEKLEKDVRAYLPTMSIAELDKAQLAVSKFEIRWSRGGITGIEYKDMDKLPKELNPRLETLAHQIYIWQNQKPPMEKGDAATLLSQSRQAQSMSSWHYREEEAAQLFVFLDMGEVNASQLALTFPILVTFLLRNSEKTSKQHIPDILKKIELLDSAFDDKLNFMNEEDIENMSMGMMWLLEKLRESNEFYQPMIDFTEKLAFKVINKMNPRQHAANLVWLDSRIPKVVKVGKIVQPPFPEYRKRLMVHLQNLLILDITNRPDYYRARAHCLPSELKVVEREVFFAKQGEQDGSSGPTTCWRVRNTYCMHPGAIIEEAVMRGKRASLRALSEKLPKVSEDDGEYQKWLQRPIIKGEGIRFGCHNRLRDEYVYPCWKSEVTVMSEQQTDCNWYETKLCDFWD